jgi:UDP-3-O-[3-hydroxymyristoyl] glucosamine N-acyltransferase
MNGFSLKYLANYIDAQVEGDVDYVVSGLASLSSASKQHVALYMGRRYKKQLDLSKAACVLLSAEDAKNYCGNKLIVDNPYLSFAQLTQLFVDKAPGIASVHASAVVASNVKIGSDVNIGANAVIEQDCQIHANSSIGAGAYLGRGVIIGSNTMVHPNVTIYHQVNIGNNCILHSGCVIGADGFGFAPSVDGWQKIHQLGRVHIGNDVEIGANTTVDRGALDDTIIEDHVKIDNLVQIAHNVRVGKGTAIAAKVGIAGSVSIGENCTIAGLVGIVGHLSITDNVHITAMTLVSKSITKAGSYSSGTKMTTTREWKKNAVRFSQLDKLARQLKSIK